MSHNDSNDSHILQRLQEPFETKERIGKGNQSIPYVTIADIQRRLNDVFGLSWSFEIISEVALTECVYVRGRLHFANSKGERQFREQFGAKQVIFKGGARESNIGDAFKSAASDCLKKCAQSLGMALDLSEPSPVVILSDAQKTEIVSLIQGRGTQLSDAMMEQLSMLAADEAQKLIESLKNDEKAA